MIRGRLTLHFFRFSEVSLQIGKLLERAGDSFGIETCPPVGSTDCGTASLGQGDARHQMKECRLARPLGPTIATLVLRPIAQ
jgi:hypothetical protein